MTELLESIKLMEANGRNLMLPTQQLANYAAVKKCLIKAGGRYKKGGYFEFPDSAQKVKDRLCGGEIINDKKEFQFFQTPPAVVEQMMELAEIKDHHRCLEPSAGLGAIANAMFPYSDNTEGGHIQTCEINQARGTHLAANGHNVWIGDFLDVEPEATFDRIVANPPFSKGQDIAHIKHMFSFLKPGGRMVTLSAPGWEFHQTTKAILFRDWIVRNKAKVIKLPMGAFKESGTNVRVFMIIVDKAE